MIRAENLQPEPRTALMAEMDDLLSAGKNLIYLCAPAGYGKTVSAQLWLNRKKAEGIQWSWITLDEYDNKPVNFCRRYTSALLEFQPDNAKLREAAEHPLFDTAPDEFTIRALSAFINDGKRHILVLDDLHVISAGEIIRLLSTLYKRMPQNRVVMFLSRNEPSGILSELAVKGEMAVIGTERIRFSNDEIKTFFNGNGHNITGEQAGKIHASTGGWAIGLRAMLLSGKRNYDVKLVEKYLNDYLATHIWEKWEPRIRECIMKTSVAEDLTPGIIEALTGETGGAEILTGLARENAFLRSVGDNAYRFHDLFRDFLMNMLEKEDESVKNGLLKKAGDWFFENGDYFKAISYFVKCKDYAGIEKAYSVSCNYTRQNANLDDRVALIRSMRIDDIPAEVLDEYPALYHASYLGHHLDGNAKKMGRAIDLVNKAMPRIGKNRPEVQATLLFTNGLDFRNSLVDHCKRLQSVPLAGFAATARVPSVSQSLPYYHRSQRDYSEWLFSDVKIFTSTLGFILGDVADVMEDCIIAGLAYEQGKTEYALEYALSANSKLRGDTISEMKFCAMIILTSALFAGGQKPEAYAMLDKIREMIEGDNAFYLNQNFRAYQFTLKLNDGDKNAAREWLWGYGESPYGHLAFYKIYQHFTTARAYIVTGDYNAAILFLKKLLDLSESYRRPLDVVESYVLLAAAYWNKGRGMRKEALEVLEKAVVLAQKYEFTQVFADVGADLSTMLYKLQNRAAQKAYAGEISAPYIKKLYIIALSHAKQSKGMTGGRAPDDLKFTERQKEVMRYLCEGLTHKEIGGKMGLKPSAVKSHMILIYKKLDVTNGVDAMIKIRESGVLN